MVMELLTQITETLIDITDKIFGLLFDFAAEPRLTSAQIVDTTPVGEFIRFLKIVGYITTPLFTGLIVWIFVKMVKLNKSIAVSVPISKLEVVPTTTKYGSALQARWDEILRHIESTREGEWKFAVIEADKLTDEILKSAGYPGETMGERLMNIEREQLQTLDGIWEAHKIRNRLVHDTNYFLRYSEAKHAIQLYEETLKELEAL